MHMRAIDPSPHLRGDRDLPRMTTLGPSADPCRAWAGGPRLRPGPVSLGFQGFPVHRSHNVPSGCSKT